MTNVALERLTVLRQDFTMYHNSHQTHTTYAFETPPGVASMVIRFHYDPIRVTDYQSLERSLIKEGLDTAIIDDETQFRNLLTLSLNDPSGFRGAHHYFNQNQSIDLSEDAASLGFLAGTIEAGRWEVIVSHHGLFSETVKGSIEVEVVFQDTYQFGYPRPLAGIQGPARVMEREPIGEQYSELSFRTAELHAHTTHSDAIQTLEELITQAEDMEIEWLALTDHNTISSAIEAQQRDVDVNIIPGIEFTTFFGHLLLHGPLEHLRINWTEFGRRGLQEFLQEAKNLPMAITIAHPFDTGNPYCTGCRWDFILSNLDGVHGIEVWNSPNPTESQSNQKAYETWVGLLAQGHEIAASAGHDWHRPLGADEVAARTHLLLSGDASLSEVIEAIQLGRSYTTLRPKIGSWVLNDKWQVGDRIPRGVLDPDSSISLELELDGIEVGDTLQVWNQSDLLIDLHLNTRNREEDYLEISIPIKVNNNKLIRLEIRNKSNDIVCFTNPIYIEK